MTSLHPARLEALKWVAVAAMVCDHLAVALLPEHQWLRAIGRFAFPVFTLAFGVGLAYTSSPLDIVRRLLAPAFVAQAAWWAITPGYPLNVLFVCIVAALAVEWWRTTPGLLRWLVLVAPLLFVLVRVEGGALGLVLIAGGYMAALGSPWLALGVAVVWCLVLPSPGFVLGVVAVLAAPPVLEPFPRVRGLLPWVYASHLAVFAALFVVRSSL